MHGREWMEGVVIARGGGVGGVGGVDGGGLVRLGLAEDGVKGLEGGFGIGGGLRGSAGGGKSWCERNLEA